MPLVEPPTPAVTLLRYRSNPRGPRRRLRFDAFFRRTATNRAFFRAVVNDNAIRAKPIAGVRLGYCPEFLAPPCTFFAFAGADAKLFQRLCHLVGHFFSVRVVGRTENDAAASVVPMFDSDYRSRRTRLPRTAPLLSIRGHEWTVIVGHRRPLPLAWELRAERIQG